MKYPIIHLFTGDKNIYAASSGPERASISLLDSFVNSVILDSDGYMYKIQSARKIKWDYFWGYHPLIKGRTAFIDYEFSQKEKLSLEAFKLLVVQKLSMGVKKNFWYTKKDIPNLIDKVSRSENFQSIIEYFV